MEAGLTAGTQLLESKAFTGGVTATHRYVQNMREGFLDGLKAQDEGILLPYPVYTHLIVSSSEARGRTAETATATTSETSA